jgi:hypothetical protein
VVFDGMPGVQAALDAQPDDAVRLNKNRSG